MCKDFIRSALSGAIATLAIGGVTVPAIAAVAETQQPVSAPGVNQEIVRKALANRHEFAATALRNAHPSGGATTTADGEARPADIYANPNAAYPPSCLTDGLHAANYSHSTDPNAQQVQVTTPIYDFNTQQYDLSETDTYTVWRVPCSGGVSAVLFEIDRPTGLSGTYTQYPTFPDVYAGSSSSPLYVRSPNDPNTVYSDTIPGTAVIDNTIYVLEYYPGSTSTQDANDNQAFTLNFDTLTSNASGSEIVATINVAAYNPASFNNFPSVSNPMEISGYMSTNWFDPAHSGEGILIQVYDNGDRATRTFTAAWYSFDHAGLPFWLFAQGSIAIGATQATNVATYYSTNGGFAGNFGAASTFTPWGTMTFSFPNCNTMNVTYNGKTDSQTDGPGGQGALTWSRLANINGLTCS